VDEQQLSHRGFPMDARWVSAASHNPKGFDHSLEPVDGVVETPTCYQLGCRLVIPVWDFLNSSQGEF
jgi:hypothetical protein